MSAPTLTVTKDFTQKFQETISRFKKDAVLIGIPLTDGPRDDDADMTNAGILALNHFGSDDGKIPPSPVLYTGLKNAQAEIAEQFKKITKEALKSGPRALEVGYERVGIIASNACKKVITDQDGLKPPADATLAARKYLTQSGFKGTKRLLVTGQVRSAITYVVKSIWGS